MMPSEQGLKDSAILLLAMGEEAAAEVFKRLTAKEAQQIGETMAKIRSTRHDRVAEVIGRFETETAGQLTLVGDSAAYIRAVLTRAVGQ